MRRLVCLSLIPASHLHKMIYSSATISDYLHLYYSLWADNIRCICSLLPHLDEHLCYGANQFRKFFITYIENCLNIHIEILVSYNISKSFHFLPFNLWMLRKNLTVRDFVQIFQTFANRNQQHVYRIKLLHSCRCVGEIFHIRTGSKRFLMVSALLRTCSRIWTASSLSYINSISFYVFSQEGIHCWAIADHIYR